MAIVGHGIDLVDVARIAQLLDAHPNRFRERCFTEAEQAYCDQFDRRAAEHFAVRFAAKEAVLKALGTGLRHGMDWTDIEIVRDDHGRPEVRLTGVAAERASQTGAARWHLSLSHTSAHAIASAIAESA